MKSVYRSFALLALPLFLICNNAKAEVDMGTYLNLCRASQDVCKLMFFSTVDGIKWGVVTNENYRGETDI